MGAVIVTGASGLIGSQACNFFHEKGYNIVGIDNDMRSYFFGVDASTNHSRDALINSLKNYVHYNTDIRDYGEMKNIFTKYGDIELVIHTAAQPSHDWATNEPLTDFTVNALGTMQLLELTRLHAPKSTFIFTSTNKVYGDRPNLSYDTGIPDEAYSGMIIKEMETRYEAFSQNNELMSVNEFMPIDHCKHSIFGASKVAADVMVQEYGKYFGMNTTVFRGGCLTGPNHAGAELHGFLSYLVKCILHNRPYTIFGYKGKQVRDNIHSLDLINMFWHYHMDPKPGAVYNAGGGRANSTSILEAIDSINRIAGTNWSNYTVGTTSRIADHIWYISDLAKFKQDYPMWDLTITLDETIKQMIEFERKVMK